jgi:hypothetical protein
VSSIGLTVSAKELGYYFILKGDVLVLSGKEVCRIKLGLEPIRRLFPECEVIAGLIEF